MFHIGGAALVTALFLGAALLPQDRTAEFRSRFAREPDPVRKAKLMRDLGHAEFQEIDGHLAAGRLAEGLAILQQYREEAQSCAKALDTMGVDAERRPSGFKQLQISLRESLRHLDELLVALSADEQRPFLGVRKDLDQTNQHLVHELFPRQPGADAPAERPKR